MIEQVSMKTLSARLPDHRAMTKPIEISSKRPLSRTSFSVFSMTSVTTSAVRTSRAPSRIRSRTSSTTSWPSQRPA